MPELKELSAVTNADSSSKQLVECEWKECKKTHQDKVNYADKANVQHNNGKNQKPLLDAKQTPWGLRSYGMLAKDRRRYGHSRPQWSYPDDEDYFLSAKKSNILERIKENKIKKSDLPAPLVAIVQDPSVPGNALIAISEYSTPPPVAQTLSSRNCFPYREQFADWSEKKRQQEHYPPIQNEFNYPCEAHHLLSKQFFGGKLGGQFTDLNHNAELVGWDVDSPKNGIMLPRFVVDIVCHGLPQHEGNHDETDYNESVGEILRNVQKYSLKLCEGNVSGGDPTTQKRLCNRLDRAARIVRKKIMDWHKSFLLRPDNLAARDRAYQRINTMILFDQARKSFYPTVPPHEQP